MGHVNQIVDLLVIIPFVFDGFFRGFVQLRLLRVTRVLRVRFSASSVCVVVVRARIVKSVIPTHH